MRGILVYVFALAACTANVAITKVPISDRVADACGDAAAVCNTTGTCLPQLAFCGSDNRQFVGLFAAEDACKSTCGDQTSCIKACKLTRTSAIESFLSVADLNGDGIAGDGTGACASLDTTCGQTGQGCTADEFFCGTTARVVNGDCATKLAECKAACAPHDRTCTRMCREAYRACLASTSTPDAGVPDAPAPDAPTPKPDAAMPDAAVPDAAVPDAPPPTTTKYTYTTDIAPKMTGLCNGCHSVSPPGNYYTNSYTALFGNGSDNTPNIIAGDANSLFLQKIAGNHHNVLNQYPGFDKVSHDWVVLNAAAK
jgi:hypothetical protein